MIESITYRNKQKLEIVLDTERMDTAMRKFKDYYLAKCFAENAKKVMLIILGDDDKFWVGFPAETEKLYRQGYEYVD